ncbi:beta-lactamase [Paenibacillus darwinianus]|uniref:Beta-lactamase n=1 Tax=Paenibacillus darwinianus TaxID=1380763 RepID=A0A9W5S0W2_9BACL|nr:MBL fold metallo-hydrolase [Paenibacillus darwinianus]EXX85572.1 beta-lactamase [Paenibacillus darwinianus]EXX88310.1 beta-lactamase [Paenibacillus darwinianus]EXX89843.1 beta-lactamase [Paenibacillus darwinianus]
MDILMLGTGSAWAKKYYNNNALLFVDGFTLMVDCGITAPAALHALGKPIDEIDALLVTHIHGDHVGGLEETAFRMRFQFQKKPVLFVPAKLVEPLWEHTLKGGLQQREDETLNDFFEVRLIEEGEAIELHPGLQVELIRTEHVPGKISYSLLLNDSFFYSSDMQFAPELVTRMVREKGCTVFHDCQLTPPGVVHAALEELLTLPEDVQEKIYLMHYPDNKDEFTGKTGLMRFVEQHRRYSI